jgi:hypothetical protein
MLSLDDESVFFHVPIHPKHRKFFSIHLELPLFVSNKFIDLQPGGLSEADQTSSRIGRSVMSVVASALHRHDMRTLLYVDDLLISCSSTKKIQGHDK